jgi:predicted amidophosphoribosyltransferase
MDGRPPVPVWAVADFAGPVRRAVSAWKDHGRTDLTPVLAAAARRAVRAAADELGGRNIVVPGLSTGGRLAVVRGPGAWGGRRFVVPGPDELASVPVLVVPAPSTAAARRRRGRDPAGELVLAVRDELARRGVAARTARVLRRAPGADQAGLSARARSRNLAGQVSVRGRPGPARAVLVDDVLTTGATFAACVRALDEAGVAVVAGVVVASTPRPGVGGAGATGALAWSREPTPGSRP